MRILIALVFVLMVQDLISQSSNLSYSLTKEIPGVSKEQLYARARKWVAKSFYESNKQVLELSDNPNVSIEGTSKTNFTTKDMQLLTVASGQLLYKFKVTIKEGKSTLELTDFIHIPRDSRYDFGIVTTDSICPKKVRNTMEKSRLNTWNELKEKAEEISGQMLESFNDIMQKDAGKEVKLSAQQVFIGLPKELSSSGIIFLRHDSAQIVETEKMSSVQKARIRNKKRHNSFVKNANKNLDEAAIEYPFKYVISYRKDIEAQVEKGYKFVFDCLAFENLKNGDYKSTNQEKFLYQLYIKDLENNILYIVKDEFLEQEVYNTKKMVRILLKEIKKNVKK